MHQQVIVVTDSFGDFLKRLRKQAGMTQDDLAAAIGYSRSLVAALERNHRLPDIETVIHAYVPALGLQEEPVLAGRLVGLAAKARGERAPASLTFARERFSAHMPEESGATYCMPVPPTAILGRDQEIDQLCGRLLEHDGRLLTLIGPPGVGKTRLALAVGAACQSYLRDGACFVSLAEVSDPALVAPAIGSALKLQGPARPQKRLIEHLRRKEMLLLLDNFEQLLAPSSTAAAQVAELLAECPHLRLMVTSRERLHLRAEQRYRVPPLALDAAVAVFLQRCAAVDAEFALTSTNRATIETICNEVDRLPLALELCAGQIDLLSPSQLLAHLQERRLELLVDGAHDLPPQHTTLRVAIGHSYALLDADERALFRSLGVFVGGCDLQAIAAVSAWDQRGTRRGLLPALHALVSKSLVRAEARPDGATRFSLLETIREFALEQVAAQHEDDVLRGRHYAAYLQLFRTADGGLRGPDAAAWLARLEPEEDNLRAAVHWTLEAGRFADTAWLMLAVAWLRNHTGRWVESSRWFAQLLPHRRELERDLRLALLIYLHIVDRSSDELRSNEQFTDEMVDLLEVCPHQIMHAWAWHFVAVRSADHASACAAWERSITCARAARGEPGLGPEFGILSDLDFSLGNPLRWYADRLIEHGDYARAMPLIMESSALFKARGSRFEMANILGTLGRLALQQGDVTKAYATLKEAVTLAKDFNYQIMVGRLQPFLGRAALYMGDGVEARRLLADSLRVCLDLNEKVYLARVCCFYAEAALSEGALDEAEQWLARSPVFRVYPRWTPRDQVERIYVAARLASARGAHLRTATLFGIAEAIRSQIDYEPAGPMREPVAAALAAARAALGLDLFTETFISGQALSLGDAFAILASG